MFNANRVDVIFLASQIKALPLGFSGLSPRELGTVGVAGIQMAKLFVDLVGGVPGVVKRLTVLVIVTVFILAGVFRLRASSHGVTH